MQYVTTVWDDGGFSVDPNSYLAELPRLRTTLPPGARSFATDPDHYDIAAATRCVKDLELSGIHLATDKERRPGPGLRTQQVQARLRPA